MFLLWIGCWSPIKKRVVLFGDGKWQLRTVGVLGEVLGVCRGGDLGNVDGNEFLLSKEVPVELVEPTVVHHVLYSYNHFSVPLFRFPYLLFTSCCNKWSTRLFASLTHYFIPVEIHWELQFRLQYVSVHHHWVVRVEWVDTCYHFVYEYPQRPPIL